MTSVGIVALVTWSEAVCDSWFGASETLHAFAEKEVKFKMQQLLKYHQTKVSVEPTLSGH